MRVTPTPGLFTLLDSVVGAIFQKVQGARSCFICQNKENFMGSLMGNDTIILIDHDWEWLVNSFKLSTVCTIPQKSMGLGGLVLCLKGLVGDYSDSTTSCPWDL